MAVHVLVVEDDETIAGAIADRLRSEGFDVTIATDGLVALDLVDQLKPGLVVLDVMLPGLDGVEVCRRIQTKVPVVMLTARDDETDMLVGLAVGADDYITKPFSMRELVARIRVVLRRVERSNTPTVLALGTLRIDEAQRRVYRNNDEVTLTPTEFDILLCLFSQQGAVRTREQLLQDVWGYRDGSGTRTVDSHVRAMRRKLGEDVIRTVHGVGYAAGEPS
jgi:DNA-binding response OmpR family regulator